MSQVVKSHRKNKSGGSRSSSSGSTRCRIRCRNSSAMKKSFRCQLRGRSFHHRSSIPRMFNIRISNFPSLLDCLFLANLSRRLLSYSQPFPRSFFVPHTASYFNVTFVQQFAFFLFHRDSPTLRRHCWIFQWRRVISFNLIRSRFQVSVKSSKKSSRRRWPANSARCTRIVRFCNGHFLLFLIFRDAENRETRST